MRLVLRAWLVALLVVLPTASADKRDQDLEYNRSLVPDKDSPVPFFYVVPCLVLDVTIARPDGGVERIDQSLAQDVCNVPRVEIAWDSTALGGRGDVVFAFDSEAMKEDPRGLAGGDPLRIKSIADEATPIQLHPVSQLLGAIAPTSASSSEPIPRKHVVVVAAFDASWAEGCAGATGRFSASVDGSPIGDAEAPAGLFQALCELSKGDPAGVALRLLDVARVVGDAVRPHAPAPGFDALLAGLAALAPRLAPLPAPPSPDAQAAGDVLVEALAEDHLVAASGNASVSSSLLPDERAPASPVVETAHAPVGPLALPAEAPPPTRALPAQAATPPVRPSRASDAAGPADAPRTEPAPTKTMLTSASPVAHRLSPAAIAGFVAPLVAAILVALYQRVSRPAALQHPRRAALHEACRALQRSATAGELAAITGMPRKSAEYHLSYLARLGLLRVEQTRDGARRFAIQGAPKPEAPIDLEVALLARVAASPGESVAELAKALGVGRLRVDRRVKDLLLAGRLESRIEEGRRRLYLS